jgi:hypothetical protein
MFREADIRAYDPKRDATPAEQPRRAKATAPHKSSRSRYAIDPEAIAAGKLPDKAPAITSEANPHYQKHFDRLFRAMVEVCQLPWGRGYVLRDPLPMAGSWPIGI